MVLRLDFSLCKVLSFSNSCHTAGRRIQLIQLKSKVFSSTSHHLINTFYKTLHLWVLNTDPHRGAKRSRVLLGLPLIFPVSSVLLHDVLILSSPCAVLSVSWIHETFESSTYLVLCEQVFTHKLLAQCYLLMNKGLQEKGGVTN